jgi:hypothetical protein
VSKAWLHQEGGFDFDAAYYRDPLVRRERDLACAAFVRRRFPHYPVYHMEDNLVQARFVAPNQLLVGAIQPNLIIAAALGADFVVAADKDSDVAGYPLRDLASAGDLPSVAAVLDLPLIAELGEQVTRYRRERPDLRVIPPFFWDTSGRATIHGIVTTALKFMGPDIFLLMLEDPGLVHAVHGWIADVYTAVVRHFSALGDLPVTSVHVGECAGTMLGGEQYREFVTPYASRLGREFGALRLHSCGHADHVLDAIADIEGLAVIDTGSDTSVAAIRRRLGPDFAVNVFPPLRVLRAEADAAAMAEWLDHTLSDNANGPLQLAYHLEPDYNESNCAYLHEELARRGLVDLGRLY